MVPILLAIGIGIFFTGNIEIRFLYTLLLSAALFIMSLLVAGKSSLLKYLLLAAFFIVSGYSLASYRILSLATPTLENELRPTNISGTVENVHMYEDGKIRLTLRDTVIMGTEPLNLVNVRVNKFSEMPYVGDKVKLRAGLMPPPGPSMPGDYDYARQVWFQGLSAVGYAVSELEITEKNDGISASISQMRQRMAERIKVQITGEAGTLAAALITESWLQNYGQE